MVAALALDEEAQKDLYYRTAAKAYRCPVAMP
jgi:hypothetical protein